MKRTLIYCCYLGIIFSASSQINTNRLLNNGKSALFFDDYVLSILYFNQIIETKPHLHEPYYYRAVAKIQLEDFLGASIDCSKALEINPFLPTAYYARGYAYKRMGNYSLAEIDFTKALEFSPDNEYYLLHRIECYEQTKEYNKALKDIEFLQSKKSTLGNLLQVEKGNIYLQQGDTLMAFESFNSAVEKDSTNPDFLGARALIYLLQNDDKNALSDYNKAIANKSKNIAHYINRGILNYRVYNYKEALSDYHKALEIDSTNTQALFNRALLRTELGDLNKAIEDYSTLLTIDSDFDEARYQRGLVSVSIKNYKQAKNDFKYLIEKYPYFVPAYYGRADADEGLGNMRQASIDRYRAQKLLEDKDAIQKKLKKELNKKEQIANNQSAIVEKIKEFDSSADINFKYNDKIRGSIQNNYTHVKIKNNYLISFYSPNDNLRQLSNYDVLLEEYKQKNNSSLLLSNQEAPLTTNLIEIHFNTIAALSEKIKQQPSTAQLYFERGIHYALVQNHDAALADFNEAIKIKNDFELAYFCKANILLKAIEYELNNKKILSQKDNTITIDNKKTALLYSTVLDNYQKVIDLAPNFSYAWYNKANCFFEQKEYTKAIDNYTQALSINNKFAEAYFNRAISYLFINQKEKALADLSKAGELGIYQAYNLIKRFQE